MFTISWLHSDVNQIVILCLKKPLLSIFSYNDRNRIAVESNSWKRRRKKIKTENENEDDGEKKPVKHYITNEYGLVIKIFIGLILILLRSLSLLK